MNYTKIKASCPKAFEKLYSRISHFFTHREKAGTLASDMDGNHLFNDRDLYDFFDEQKIWININRIDKLSIAFNEDGEELWAEAYKSIHKTANDCETAAFTKAFEILEERL